MNNFNHPVSLSGGNNNNNNNNNPENQRMNSNSTVDGHKRSKS